MRTLLIVTSVLAVLAFLSTVASAAADVSITALDCGTHPRRIRIENLGDQAANLAGWELRSDPLEGEPFDLGQAGSLAAGQKIYVFQGHLAPPQDPSVSFYRWGVDSTFFLRANDSNDYVEIVDAQGNSVDKRHCEGVPGGTPDPAYESQFATPTPVVTPSPTAAPSTSNPVGTPAPQGAGGSASSNNGNAAAGGDAPVNASDLPAQGGPPPVDHGASSFVLLTGVGAILAGLALLRAGTRKSQSSR